MPTAVDKLSKDSDESQIKAAISDCIATEVNRGTPQQQATAMCMQMAKTKVTGQSGGPPPPPQGGAAQAPAPSI